MSHGLKLLLLAAGTIITLTVVTLSLGLARQSRKIDLRVSENLNDIYRDLDQSEITMYDGLEVTGADVVNFLKKHMSSYLEYEAAPFHITVITQVSPIRMHTYYNKKYIKEVQNFTNVRYIKPLNLFVGETVYNENEVITEVKFTVK